MNVRAPGELATHLAWIPPRTASLLALARLPAPAAWARLRSDPGAVLLVVRSAGNPAGTPARYPQCLSDGAIPAEALRLLDETLNLGDSELFESVDWELPARQPILRHAIRIAALAQGLALSTGRADSDQAWIAGLLAPLGWLALSACDPEFAQLTLTDPDFAHDPAGTERRLWGLDQAAVARRLLRRWQVPRWLAVIVGHLGLPLAIAAGLGADADLFRIVQTAVTLAQSRERGLGLAVGADPAELLAELALGDHSQDKLLADLAPEGAEELPTEFPKACSRILLRDILSLAIENRRLQNAPLLEQLEHDQDVLHQTVERLRGADSERLHQLKLQALAEFAAGAAHEINNPLAVISGQAQYLLHHEEDAGRQRSLQTIVGQTQRIHQILKELMQFARPPRPNKQAVDVRSLLRDVALALSDLAIGRQVQLVCADPDPIPGLQADPKQLGQALECLLRNAIEAAPEGGWASLRLERPTADTLEFVIEDNGKGPAPAQRDHLFDPFYSGRQAGRGKGLGLPTAWRLAREHGGDVRFENLADGPTRFVLRMPLEASSNGTANSDLVADAADGPASGHPATDEHWPLLSD